MRAVFTSVTRLFRRRSFLTAALSYPTTTTTTSGVDVLILILFVIVATVIADMDG